MGKLCRVGPGKLFERQPATDLGEGFLMESVRFLHKLMSLRKRHLKSQGKSKQASKQTNKQKSKTTKISVKKWVANDLKVPEVGGLRRIPGTC